MKFAEEKGIYAFGQASDMAQFGPKAQLTSIIDNWNPYYLARVKALSEMGLSTRMWTGGYNVPPTTLLDSVRTLAGRYPPETIVYPGHGPQTTLGAELERNPFLAELRA